MIGLRHRYLQIVIHGFAFLKVAKPAYEHNLQVLPALRKPSSVPFIATLKMLPHIMAYEICIFKH